MNNEKEIPLKKGEIEKRIWGHRLYDDQTGMLTLLEFLCVLRSKSFESQNKDPSKKPDKNTCFLSSYGVPKRTLLRSLVFNNPYVNEKKYDNPWNDWKELFINDEQNKDVDSGNGDKDDGQKHQLARLDDLENLKKIFAMQGLTENQSFDNFSEVINLLSSSGINVGTNRRWTSKFLFPWGKNCLYLEVDDKGKAGDRRFFARNGELLYLMLSFAEKREKLEELINEKLLNSNNDFDKIARALSLGDETDHPVQGSLESGCVVPVDFFEYSRRRINIICEDLIQLFSLPIPLPDIVVHSSRMIMLNLYCYFLEQARSVITHFDSNEAIHPGGMLLCEAVQRQTNGIRECSKKFFSLDSALSCSALRIYYKNNAVDSSRNKEIEEIDYDSDGEVDGDSKSLDENSNKDDSIDEILNNHRKHWGANLVRSFGKDCGLVSKLYTNAFRYAPSDALLQSLAAVLIPKKRLLLNDFLTIIHERYGLVYDKTEFNKVKVTHEDLIPNPGELVENRRRLHTRLESLGLLVSLSDGFDFILNPCKR